MKHLYCRAGEEFNNDIPIKVFVPSITNGFFIRGEKLKLKDLVLRIVLWLITFGKAKIYYLIDEGGN